MSPAHARHRRPGLFARRRLIIVIALGAVIVIALVLVLVVVPSTKSPSTGATNAASSHAPTSGAATTASGSASTTTTTPLPAPNAVTVSVLNASDTNGLAAQTGAGLTHAGFTVSGVGNATSKIAAGSPSQIYYGSGGLPAAHALGNALSGPISYVANATVTGNSVILWVANAQLTVTPTTGTVTSPTIASSTG
jgi:LytR cell envelope-related transcriptional attenuator